MLFILSVLLIILAFLQDKKRPKFKNCNFPALESSLRSQQTTRIVFHTMNHSPLIVDYWKTFSTALI